jgi:hypothetical protein
MTAMMIAIIPTLKASSRPLRIPQFYLINAADRKFVGKF